MMKFHYLPGFAAMNALAASVDLLGILVIAWQVPHGALVRNQGWYTWWKIPETPTTT